MLNSGGGDITVCAAERCDLAGFNVLSSVGNGYVADGDRSGDLGLFNIVAYNEPSNGPCVCCDESVIKNKIRLFLLDINLLLLLSHVIAY